MKHTVLRPAFFIILLMVIILSTGMALSQTPVITTVPQYMTGVNSLSGTIYDNNHDAIPGAQVTLYYTQFLPPNEYKALEPVNIPNNPQSTGNGGQSPAGHYEFGSLQPDVYAVTAEINGIAYSQDVQVVNGNTTMDLTIPNYTYQTVPNSSTASAVPTYQPPPGWNTTPVQSGNGINFSDVFRVFLICLIVAQLVVSLAILIVISGRSK